MKTGIIFILLSAIVIYAGIKQANAEDKYFTKPILKYSTIEIRQMWEMCSLQFMRVHPNVQRMQRIKLCDCYVDHMRTKHTPEEVKALSPEESKSLGREMAVVCPILPPYPPPTS
tara:strand:- start:230 stop:574 length:345 start_codon:yes stop_codon:yes gene_type:complete